MWRTVKLGDVCKIINGGTPKSKVSEYWDGDVQWLTPKDMGKLKSRHVSETERKISQKGLANSFSETDPSERSNFVVSCSNWACGDKQNTDVIQPRLQGVSPKCRFTR